MTWGWLGEDNRALEFPDETTPEFSPPNRARVIYSQQAQALLMSIDGGAYTPLSVGSPAAAAQAAWFIDPVNGDDAAEGLTSGTAIRTHEEMRRRIGNQLINQATTVTLLNDFPTSNPVIIDFWLGDSGSLRYVGVKTLTTLYTGSFTAVGAINRAGNLAQTVTDTAIPVSWTAAGLLNTSSSSARRIRITGGARAGAVAWAGRDLTGFTARTSPFGTLTTAPLATFPTGRVVSPQVGDPFVVESGFVRVDRLVVDLKGPPFLPAAGFGILLLFNEIEVDPAQAVRPLISSAADRIAGSPVVFSGCACGRLTSITGNVDLEFCRYGGVSMNSYGLINLQATLVLGTLSVLHPSVLQAAADTLFQGVNISVFGRASFSDVAVFNAAANGLTIFQNAVGRTVALFPGAGGAIYGSGNGAFGCKIHPYGALVYDAFGGGDAAAAGLTVTGTSGDVQVGGTTSTWVAIAPDLAVAAKLAAVSANT